MKSEKLNAFNDSTIQQFNDYTIQRFIINN